MLAASLLTTLRSRERKRSPIKPTHSRPLLAYAAEPSHGSLEKEWAVHLTTFPHPGRPHFSDDSCVQPTSHYSGNTKINSMRASCPPLPQCSGSHSAQGLLAWEPALAWLTTDVPPSSPLQLRARAFFPGPIVITKYFTGPPQMC